MITDKDREEAINVIAAYLGGGKEQVAKELSFFRAELAEQARKEAAENGILFMQERLVPGVFTDIMLDELRAAILDDSASDHIVGTNKKVDQIPDTGKKLAIAVKALEEIATLNTGTWDKPVPFSVLWNDSSRIITDALKDIQ